MSDSNATFRQDLRVTANENTRGAWLLRCTLAAVRQVWNHPRELRALADMPDYLLKDIGFERDGQGTVRRWRF